METPITFRPPILKGAALHILAAVGLSLAGAAGLWQITRAEVGPEFLLYLLPLVLAIALLPFSLYRAIALLRAAYTVERDGTRLHWGLRTEVIPMNRVLWVRPAAEIAEPLRLPWMRLPGAVLGVRQSPQLGEVEYLASDSSRLVLIATPERIYAVSPDRPDVFEKTFRRLLEYGSLSPLPARSVTPTFLLARVWSDAAARNLLAVGLGLSLALAVWTSVAAFQRAQVYLSFDALGHPRDPVPAVRLLLLPVLNALLFLSSLLGGMFFFPRQNGRFLALVLWSSCAGVPFLFLMGAYFLLRAG